MSKSVSKTSLVDYHPVIISTQSSLPQCINKKTNKGSKYLVDKYTPYKILKQLEKIQMLEIEREVKDKQITLTEFVRVFMKHMNFNPQEREYLAVGLIELFRDVKDYEKKFQNQPTHQATNQLKQQQEPVTRWESLTGYFIDNVIQGGMKRSTIANKYISKLTSEKYKQVYGAKELEHYTPEVIGGSSLCLRRFKKSSRFIDSQHHNQGIRNVEHIGELGVILVLDNLTDQIVFYDANKSQKLRYLKPKPEHHILDTGILYFTYSHQERRIGACLQDYSLAFWDQNDNFTFEKSFSAHLEVLQIFIKYVEYCTTWLTIDQKNVLYIWDIEKEEAEALPRRHEERITDVCEITHLRLLAACSLDKRVIFWDLVQRVPAQIMKLDGGISAHSMCYCSDFRVLITAQYENTLSLWSFENKDCSLLSRLSGHNSQVTAIAMLRDTPLLISADEIGFVKTWDVRRGVCVQTLHYECKSSIHQFVNIDDQRFIGIEYRLHWFEFEDPAIVNANGIEFRNMTAVAVRYNKEHNQLCIATKSDVRVVDMRTGRTQKLLANLVKDEDGQQSSDITHFRLTQDGKKFLVGDNKGKVRTYQYQTAGLETVNAGHAQEITDIAIDNRNGMIISAGWDSQIMVQKIIGQRVYVKKGLSGEDSEVEASLSEDNHTLDDYSSDEEISHSHPLRSIKNAHFNQEIQALQFSERLSMIATAAQGIIFLWDYETMKLIGGMTNAYSEVLILQFMDPYPLLAGLDLSGHIIVWGPFKQGALTFNVYRPQFALKLQSDKESIIANKMVYFTREEQDFDPSTCSEHDTQHPQFEAFKSKTQSSKSPSLLISDDTGTVHVLDLSEQLAQCKVQTKALHAMKVKEFNPQRVVNQGTNGLFYKESELQEEFNKKDIMNPIVHLQNKNFAMSGPPCKQYTLVDEVLSVRYRVAQESLFVLSLIVVPPKLVVTSTNTQIVKIWSLFGDCLCIMDIDQPLPYKWKVKVSTFKQREKKYKEAIEVLEKIKKSHLSKPKTQDDKLQEPHPMNHSLFVEQAFERAASITKQKKKESKLITNSAHISKKNSKNYLPQAEGKQIVQGQLEEEEAEVNNTQTFQQFLHRIENEESMLKNPKKYSLKVMEARKSKGKDEFKGRDNKFKAIHMEHNNNYGGGGGNDTNRQMQGGSNLTQISLLDKIESMINAPQRRHPVAKEWEKAIDEDVRMIRKAKRIVNESENAAAGGNIIHFRKQSIRRMPDLGSFTQRDNRLAKIQELVGPTNKLKFEPPIEIQEHLNQSISSYHSAHVITLFNDKVKMPVINGPFKTERSLLQQATLGDHSSAALSAIGRSKLDWLSYAYSKADPLPQQLGQQEKILMSDDQSTMQKSVMASANQNLEAKRIRSKIFKELDLKRKHFKKNFATVSDYNYVDTMKNGLDGGDNYDPPNFIKQLTSVGIGGGGQMSARNIGESLIGKYTSGDSTQRGGKGLMKNASASILPMIRQSKL